MTAIAHRNPSWLKQADPLSATPLPAPCTHKRCQKAVWWSCGSSKRDQPPGHTLAHVRVGHAPLPGYPQGVTTLLHTVSSTKGPVARGTGSRHVLTRTAGNLGCGLEGKDARWGLTSRTSPRMGRGLLQRGGAGSPGMLTMSSHEHPRRTWRVVAAIPLSALRTP